MPSYEVSCIGPLNIDLLISGDGPSDLALITAWDGPAEMEMTAAGSMGYTARAMARLGLRVRLTSSVPDDALGAFIVETLRREQIDTRGVTLAPDTLAGIAVYVLLFGSRKRPLIYRMPTHDPWPRAFGPHELDETLDARMLFLSGLLHFRQMWHTGIVTLMAEAKRRGLVTVLDPQFPLFAWDDPWLAAMDDLLPSVDVLLCDEHEAEHITHLPCLDEAARALLARGPGLVVIKQGDQGSTVYRSDREPIRQQAIQLGEVVDTIGAGDAYDAGFVYGLLRGWPPERCALFASVAAGQTVTGIGATQAMPDAAQVEGIITKLGL